MKGYDMQIESRSAMSVDDAVEQIIDAIKQAGGGQVDIDVVDVVLRPYLKILEGAAETGTRESMEDMLRATHSLAATMVINLITNIIARDDAEGAADLGQQVLDNMANLISRHVADTFTHPGEALPH